MKRLIRLSAIDIQKLEDEYMKMIERCKIDRVDNKDYKLKPLEDNDVKTFMISPKNLVDYDDNLVDTTPRPGIPGLWSDSMRWIYK